VKLLGLPWLRRAIWLGYLTLVVGSAFVGGHQLAELVNLLVVWPR
jgi:hypothetical protein